LLVKQHVGRKEKVGSFALVHDFEDIMKKGDPLVVYGRGNQSRDFVHVSDVVDSILLAIRTSACQA